MPMHALPVGVTEAPTPGWPLIQPPTAAPFDVSWVTVTGRVALAPDWAKAGTTAPTSAADATPAMTRRRFTRSLSERTAGGTTAGRTLGRGAEALFASAARTPPDGSSIAGQQRLPSRDRASAATSRPSERGPCRPARPAAAPAR